MAYTNHSGSRRTAQVHLDPFSGDLRLYETIASLNLGFEQALENLAYLDRLDLFRNRFPSYFVKICSTTLEEMRAWANFELAEVIGERAQTDWARFGRLRSEWEKKLSGPGDAPVSAGRRKQKPTAKKKR